ncbi:hypothetical protein OUZ56_026537 [Daphnia magna]|uniref:Uncharacterized protein n=1 Tax=Daphnia magna TaxID=35525 RepID=A0ABQ9ZNE0_9CRUS|nr:hypothetical protein OUZ56_026537 [Daphnia magna]
MKKFVKGAGWTVVDRENTGSGAILVESQCSNLIARGEDVHNDRQKQLYSWSRGARSSKWKDRRSGATIDTNPDVIRTIRTNTAQIYLPPKSPSLIMCWSLPDGGSISQTPLSTCDRNSWGSSPSSRNTGAADGEYNPAKDIPRMLSRGMSDSEWVVVTDISFGPIEGALNKLHLWFTGSARSERLRAQIVETGTDGLELSRIIRDWYDTLNEVAGGPRRPKRGIIDIGGTTLHWMFGAATNQDLEGLNGQLQALGGKTTRIVNAVAYQATLVNETLRKHGEHVLAMQQLDREH